MDDDRFDALARSLAATGSRRRALTATLSGALGTLGLLSPDTAEAGGTCKPACNECQTCKKGACRKTKHGKKCKKGTCQPLRDGTGCSGGGFCQSGACACPLGTQFCATCVNTQTNKAHCGSCGVVCTQYKTCCQGTCKNPNGTPECCLGPGEICTPDGGITFGSYVCCSKSCDTGAGKSNQCT